MKRILLTIGTILLLFGIAILIKRNNIQDNGLFLSTQSNSDSKESDDDNVFLIMSKENKLEFASSMLEGYTKEQMGILKNEIIPIILREVVDKFASDYEKVLKDYDEHWFANEDDFNNAWTKYFNFSRKYKTFIDSCLTEYNMTIMDFYGEVCRNVGVNIIPHLDLPKCFNSFEIPKEKVKFFFDEERKKNIYQIFDLAIDGICIIVEVASVGTATPIVAAVQVGKTAYDAYDFVTEELKESLGYDEPMEDNEKLFIAITEALMLKIGSYIEIEYYKCFKNNETAIYNHLKTEIK